MIPRDVRVALRAQPAMWLSRLLESASWSLLLVTLMVTGWRLDSDARVSGLVVAGWFLLRPAMPLLIRRVHPWSLYLLLLILLGATIAGWWLGALDQLTLLLLAAVAVGGMSSLGSATRGVRPGLVVEASALAVTGRLDRLSSRLGLLLGALLGALTMLFAAALAVWTYAALVAGAMVLAVAARRAAGVSATEPSGGQAPRPADERSGGRIEGAFMPLVQASRGTFLLIAAAVGALAGGLLALLPDVVTRAQLDPAFVGFALALIGLGGLASIPLGRVRPRVPPIALVSGLLAANIIAVALIGLLHGLVALVLLLPLVGLMAATLDGEQLLGLRRAGARAGDLRGLLVAAGIGQLVGALVVALMGSAPEGLGGPLGLLAVGAAGATAFVLLRDRAALFALRHQVQQFSWNARPAPRPFEAPPTRTRAERLAGWINRQADLELVDVSLPISRRHYSIARPSGDGRDLLFEQAKADPERQMPYWAKVWPSGVALADLVVERAVEVRDQQVLELGAGLGVTACSVLEEGGRLITADYSLLPLAMCRLNGLLNTGRAPGSTCFNWRDEAQVREVLRRHPSIGLILAADVLYEFRDIAPLIDVIERLLAPGGSLWLAEPVRATAQRFLNEVAGMGWSIDSRRIRAEWPDATDGWVNIHVIRREAVPSEAAIGLGGWQI